MEDSYDEWNQIKLKCTNKWQITQKAQRQQRQIIKNLLNLKMNMESENERQPARKLESQKFAEFQQI